MPNLVRKLVRVQEKGQVTLPAEVRRRLGLKKGDLVAVEETAEGVLIKPQQAPAPMPENRIEEVLRERGMSLDDFIHASHNESSQILKEAFGLPADAAEETVSRRAKEDFFAVVDGLRRRNRDEDPDEVYREVTAIVEEVRQQRYDQRKD